MDKEQYDLMYRLEDSHWWYVGMREIVRRQVERHMYRGQPLRTLDAGCGTGGNLAFFERYGSVVGVDFAAEALNYSRRRVSGPLLRGSVVYLPFADASFDLVTSFDVLCHRAVTDDVAALREFHRVLRPGGYVILKLPAYAWLMGRHDALVHNSRRYAAPEVRAKLAASGFAVVKVSYVNCLLFPLAMGMRFGRRLLGTDFGREDLTEEPALLNAVLGRLLALEALPLTRLDLPWGLSLLALGRAAQV